MKIFIYQLLTAYIYFRNRLYDEGFLLYIYTTDCNHYYDWTKYCCVEIYIADGQLLKKLCNRIKLERVQGSEKNASVCYYRTSAPTSHTKHILMQCYIRLKALH